jgi:hypothetical protein
MADPRWRAALRKMDAKVLWRAPQSTGTARPHLLKIFGASKSVVAVTAGRRACFFVRSRNRADHGAVFSVQHLFCSFEGTQFWTSHPASPGASL